MLDIFQLSTDGNRDFNFECFALSYKYTWELAKLRFIKYRRINIIVYDRGPKDDIIWISPLKEDVLNIYYKKNIADYTYLSEKDKYAFQLQIINEGLQSLSLKVGWDFSLIQAISNDIVSADFVFSVPHKLKGLRDNCKFLVKLGLKSQTFYLRFANTNGDISDVNIFEGFVGPLYMYNLFYSAKYEKEYLKITGINKRITFEVNLLTMQVTITYSEKNLEFILPGLSPAASEDNWSRSLNAIHERWKK